MPRKIGTSVCTRARTLDVSATTNLGADLLCVFSSKTLVRIIFLHVSTGVCCLGIPCTTVLRLPLLEGGIWLVLLLVRHLIASVSGTEKPMISDKLAVFCMVRVYLLVRVVRDATRVYSRRRLIYDGGYRERGGPEINYKLALKAVMINYEALFVAVVYGGSIVVLAYMWHVAERDWQPEDFTFKNCVWLVIFQLAACDYAGLAPKSDIGVLMGVVVVVWGLVIISMLVNVIFNTVVLSSYEGWAIDWLDQYELCEKRREASAQVLKTWWQYKMSKKGGSGASTSRMDEASYIINLVQQYKYLREVTYQVGTNSGERASDPVAESQAKMKSDLQLLIAKMHSPSDVDSGEAQVQGSSISMGDRTAALGQRVEALESALEVILAQTKEVFTKTMGRAPPEPPSED